jgi:Ca2+-binding EF-hand superfamily protein
MNANVVWAVVLVAATLSGCARAQGQRAARMMQELEQRFAQADRDHDGRLTREEAREGMPWADRNFDAIDTSHTGSIDLAQVKAFARDEYAQRRGAR